MEERTEYVGIRMSKREKAMFERISKKQDMALSDYLRAGAMLMAMMDGDKEAISLTAGLVKEKVLKALAVAPVKA